MVSISARTFRVVRIFPVVDEFVDVGLRQGAKGKEYALTLDREAGFYWATRTIEPSLRILTMPARLADALLAAAIRDGAITPAKYGQPPETS